ncbi:SAM-dependent methyltransferase [Streptomyces goshikiensis]|uniref:SAM-dependent methyltransferase n=1 Tax=Streptomyces goshikiensis TaxID=1942 RepID=UPI00369FD099
MDVETFRALLTEAGQAALAAVRDRDPASWRATLTGLRWDHSAELVSAAVEQDRLRREAVAKFGEHAHRMYFTRDGLERASHLDVGVYKQDRLLHEIGVVFVDALPLGIGAEASVLGWSHVLAGADADPLNIAITAENSGVLGAMDNLALYHQDVMTYRPQGEAVFVDLMRRGAPGVSIGVGVGVGVEVYAPSLPWALAVVREMGAGAVRLSPELAHQLLPDGSGADEAEWISWNGDVQEAVLWFGLDGDRHPAAPVRRATLLPGGASLTSRGLPEPAVRPAGRYLYEPDGAVVRAGLLAELAEDVGGGLLDGGAPLITSDEPRATAFATAYEITGVEPFDAGRSASGAPEEAPVFLTRDAGDPARLARLRVRRTG